MTNNLRDVHARSRRHREEGPASGRSGAPRYREPERRGAGAVSRGGEILLVEDDPDGVLLAKRALRKNGLDHAVVVARDGEEALEYLVGPEGRGSPGLVMLDLRLPKVDGLEVLARMRAEGRAKDLPVVLMVSSEGELDAMAGRGAGLADLCIEKAVDFERFVGAVGVLRHLLSVGSASPRTRERVACDG